jgi:penicillin V acylase-like amidase (Ntn superfamily)
MGSVERRLKIIALLCLMASVLMIKSQGFACTGLTLTGKDGTVVYGRTMEWGGL